jgi:hypothetical protein
MWKAFNSLFPWNTRLSEILPTPGQQGSVVNSSPRGSYSEWSRLGVCQPLSPCCDDAGWRRAKLFVFAAFALDSRLEKW